MTTGLLIRQAFSASVGLAQALAATSLAFGAAQTKASFDAKDEEASASGRVIGGLALPIIAGLTSLYLARCSYARLAPKTAMRKVGQLDPKLAWPTLGAKVGSFATAFLMPGANAFKAYKNTWKEPVSDEQATLKAHFLRALHRDAFTELKKMWKDPSPVAGKHTETTLQSKRWEAFKHNGQTGLDELLSCFKETLNSQKDCVQTSIDLVKRQLTAQEGK